MSDWFEDDDDNLIECDVCGNMNHPDETECGYCGEPLMGVRAGPVYVDKRFNDDHLGIIKEANRILGEYERQGFTLTLRQLYYQFIAQDYFPNTEQSYKRLGGIITDARLAGLISFSRIEDRGRQSNSWFVQDNPLAVLDDLKRRYAEDLWADQPYYVEVWVEKDALSSVIERPCARLAVPYMACKGYMSASAAWEAGQRFKEAREDGKQCVLVHLGDHDPSGIDMTRDNHERLELFSEGDVHVERIALNMDQVRRYNPPPNPAKLSDSRARDYIRSHGKTSWELDALTPQIIDSLITDTVRGFIDDLAWEDVLERQRANKEMIQKITDNKSLVFDFVEGL